MKSSRHAFRKLLTMVSSSFLILKLALRGLISPEETTYLLLGCVLLTALGGLLGRWVLALGGIPAFVYLLTWQSPEHFLPLLGQMLALLLLLLALWVMLRALLLRHKS